MSGPALLAAAALLLLAGAAAFARRRLQRPKADDALRVVERLPLSRDAGVALVFARGELLLVGWGREGVRRITRLPPQGPA